MASIGLAPQDLKYRGERTRLSIGRRNIFREFVTINRGTAGGGGETTIGDNNLFMAYVHVAHDCHIGNDTIFGPHATLGGHVGVEDFANISAGSAVHQFCRVGRHAFVGGYSVVTKDALPFARTIGSRPARIFGVNTIGLSRRGFTPDTIAQLRQAYRYLLQSKLNTTRALAQIEQDESLDGAGGPLPGRLHPHAPSAASSCAGRRAAPRSWSPTNEARPHRRQRTVPVPRARRRARAGARRHDHRDQGRDLPRVERRGRAARRGDSLDLARPARHLHQPAEGGRRDARGDGRSGQAHEDLRRRDSGSDVHVGADEAHVEEHRRPDRRRGRRPSRQRHRADRLDLAADAAAGRAPAC